MLDYSTYKYLYYLKYANYMLTCVNIIQRKSVNFADELAQSFGNTASSSSGSANTLSQQQHHTGILADDDIPEFISRLRKKK